MIRRENGFSNDFWVLALAVAIGPVIAFANNDPYLLSLFERVLVYALAAASLNLILGFGGMVSFGHAAFLGLGAYTTGVMANAGHDALVLQIVAVLGLTGVAGLIFGAIALRTSGVFFIMITLAFAQIFYYFAVGNSEFGGDDGMVIYERSTLGPFYDPFAPYQFYWLLATVAAGLILLINALVRTEFGRRLIASRENPMRAQALGFNVFATRLAAFVLSGMICGIAGLLLANHSEFATPYYADWHRSGELLAIVILGGYGTRLGPVYGAFGFVLIEHLLADLTPHWALFFGIFLLIVILFFRGGLAGGIARLAELTGRRS